MWKNIPKLVNYLEKMNYSSWGLNFLSFLLLKEQSETINGPYPLFCRLYQTRIWIYRHAAPKADASQSEGAIKGARHRHFSWADALTTVSENCGWQPE